LTATVETVRDALLTNCERSLKMPRRLARERMTLRLKVIRFVPIDAVYMISYLNSNLTSVYNRS